jgi:phage I-like protein
MSEDQLWAVVDWTPVGRRTLADKEFAYLSADFDPAYKDNETPDKNFGTVLLGAGLTNRPVIKKMNPAIQLSEYSQNNNKESKMTEEQMVAAEAKLAEVNKLMEDMGVASVEELMKMISELKSTNEVMSDEKAVAEKTFALSELFSKGKITKAQQDAAIKLKGEVFEGFVKLAELNEGIKTKEVGDTGNKNGGSSETTDPEDKLLELAEAMAKDKKIGIASAINIVLSENTELKNAYYKKVGTYNGEEE